MKKKNNHQTKSKSQRSSCSPFLKEQQREIKTTTIRAVFSKTAWTTTLKLEISAKILQSSHLTFFPKLQFLALTKRNKTSCLTQESLLFLHYILRSHSCLGCSVPYSLPTARNLFKPGKLWNRRKKKKSHHVSKWGLTEWWMLQVHEYEGAPKMGCAWYSFTEA